MNTCPFVENLYKSMAYYGFNAIQYCNGYAIGTILPDMPTGKRWRVGVWSGPNRTIMSLKFCDTEEEALALESPLGWDIADALEAAILRLGALRTQ
jgi:hypothetical protein